VPSIGQISSTALPHPFDSFHALAASPLAQKRLLVRPPTAYQQVAQYKAVLAASEQPPPKPSDPNRFRSHTTSGSIASLQEDSLLTNSERQRNPREGCMEFRADARNSIHQKSSSALPKACVQNCLASSEPYQTDFVVRWRACGTIVRFIR
jgi:hypothetical protein